MIEEWKDIPDYTHYQVSNLGNVRSKDRVINQTFNINGKEKIVQANIKGKLLKPGRDKQSESPFVRLVSLEGYKTTKRSVPKLVMDNFGPKCPGKRTDYVVSHIDGDKMNNVITNLDWIHKSIVASAVGKSIKGIPQDNKKKYKNIVFKINDTVLRVYSDVQVAAFELNDEGFTVNESSISRAIKSGQQLYLMKVYAVTDEEYEKAQKEVKGIDLNILYDILVEDRAVQRKEYAKKYGVKVLTRTKIKYKDKPIVKVEKVIEKVPVEKIVYRDRIIKEKVPVYHVKTITKRYIKEVPTTKIVYKNTPVKKTKPILNKTTVPKVKDNWKEPTDKDIKDLEEQMKKEKFMKEMMKRMNIHK